jgi:hypothetical protein
MRPPYGRDVISIVEGEGGDREAYSALDVGLGVFVDAIGEFCDFGSAGRVST